MYGGGGECVYRRLAAIYQTREILVIDGMRDERYNTTHSEGMGLFAVNAIIK